MQVFYPAGQASNGASAVTLPAPVDTHRILLEVD